MTTPKNDLLEESTDPAGENLEPPDLIRSSDAHLAGDAQSHHLGRGEIIMPPPVMPPDIRATGMSLIDAVVPSLDPARGIVPQAPLSTEIAPPKWRGVRSKSLPIRVVQSMTRAARMMYRGVLDWSLGQPRTLLESKPKRTPEAK